MMPQRFRDRLGAALLAGMWIVACGSDSTSTSHGPNAAGGGVPDAGPTDAVPADASGDDARAKDADSRTDAGAFPNLGPGEVADLAGTLVSPARVKLAWTSPNGATSTYDIRHAETAITTEAEFLAAKPVTPPPPLPPGTQQTLLVEGLAPETTYHFALRVKDKSGAFGPLSNDAEVRTVARATVLVSEIAPANTDAEGGDFIELVTTKAGSLVGLTINYLDQYKPAVYTFGALDVAEGDRIVVHTRGTPGPLSYAQEDITRDRTSSKASDASPSAYDVYSDLVDLPRSATIAIMDDEQYVDAVPYSNRNIAEGDSLALISHLFASFAAAWTVPPFDDCSVVLDAVNASGDGSPGCGSYPAFVGPGISVQRHGTVDTNSAADFSSAPQTRGEPNATTTCSVETTKLAIAEVNPRAGLVELQVLEGGSLRGTTLRTNPQDFAGSGSGSELVALPNACVATGDVIIVHLGTNATPSETTGKAQHPHATYSAYYDGAWDVVTNQMLPYASSLVLAIRNAANVFTDAVAFSDRSTTAPGEYVASLRWVQQQNLWLPADCGGASCGNSTSPTAREVAVDWSLLDATTGTSAKRTGNGVPSQANQWTVGTSSFGQ